MIVAIGCLTSVSHFRLVRDLLKSIPNLSIWAYRDPPRSTASDSSEDDSFRSKSTPRLPVAFGGFRVFDG